MSSHSAATHLLVTQPLQAEAPSPTAKPIPQKHGSNPLGPASHPKEAESNPSHPFEPSLMQSTRQAQQNKATGRPRCRQHGSCGSLLLTSILLLLLLLWLFHRPAALGYHLCRRAASCCCCAGCCCRCCMDGSILRRATSKSAMHTARCERCSTMSQPQQAQSQPSTQHMPRSCQ